MDTIRIGERVYEVISFTSRITNRSMPTNGISLAGGYIAVSGSENAYRIFNTRSGEPILRCRFRSLSDAIKFAEWIEKVYADYFEIWQDYPKADIISWCKYTVPNGIDIFGAIEVLNTKDVISLGDVKEAVEKTRKEENHWKH